MNLIFQYLIHDNLSKYIFKVYTVYRRTCCIGLGLFNLLQIEKYSTFPIKKNFKLIEVNFNLKFIHALQLQDIYEYILRSLAFQYRHSLLGFNNNKSNPSFSYFFRLKFNWKSNIFYVHRMKRKQKIWNIHRWSLTNQQNQCNGLLNVTMREPFSLWVWTQKVLVKNPLKLTNDVASSGRIF